RETIFGVGGGLLVERGRLVALGGRGLFGGGNALGRGLDRGRLGLGAEQTRRETARRGHQDHGRDDAVRKAALRGCIVVGPGHEGGRGFVVDLVVVLRVRLRSADGGTLEVDPPTVVSTLPGSGFLRGNGDLHADGVGFVGLARTEGGSQAVDGAVALLVRGGSRRISRDFRWRVELDGARLGFRRRRLRLGVGRRVEAAVFATEI